MKTENEENQPWNIKSYSVDEILAAGGPTAFAEKMGKSAQKLVDYLNSIPDDCFLTEEEYQEVKKQMDIDKENEKLINEIKEARLRLLED